MRGRSASLVLAGVLGAAVAFAPTSASPAAPRPEAVGAAASVLAGPVPVPQLSRPPAGIHGHPLWDSWHRLKPFGYQQREYLVSGTARALDGTTAPYTT